jgi:hypothetical protein
MARIAVGDVEVSFRSGFAQSLSCSMTIDMLSSIAAAQHGAFTVHQARRAGVTSAEMRHRLATGEWERRHTRVFVVRGVPPSWLTDVHAATLARDGAVASHRAGAWLHRLEGVDNPPVEIMVSRARLARVPGVVVHGTSQLAPIDLTRVSGVPVTTIARTLCDLGAVVDAERLERALDSALRGGLPLAQLRETLARLDRPGPSGVRALARVLDLPHRRNDVPATTFERLMRAVLLAPLLPPIEPEYRLRDARGRIVARFDVAFPAVRVGVEAHSDAWHFGARRGERDRRRDRAVAELSWETVYLSWAEVNDPDEAVASLRAICRGRAALVGVDPLTWQPLVNR